MSVSREDAQSALRNAHAKLRKQEQQAKPNGQDPAARTITTIDFTSMPEVEPPPRRFIAEGWLPVPCLSSCYGGPGIGKSMIGQQLGTCVAAGVPFFGSNVECVPVLGIFAEDDDEELKRRQWRINRAFGLKFADLEHLHIEGAAGLDNMLCCFPGGSLSIGPLYGPLIAEAREINAGLIMLDNRAQMFLGNENDRAMATYSANLAAGIARTINGAVLLFGHDAKTADSEYSGSTAWDAVTRSRWWLHRVPNGDDEPDLILERRKTNYAPPDKIKLVWRNGVLHAVDEQHMTPEDLLAAKLRHGAAQQQFLNALDVLTAQGRPVSHSKQAKNYAPKFMSETRLAADFSARELEQAMHSLFGDKRILANQVVGKRPNRSPVTGIARI
jgi:RecA-family ATPase